MFALLCYIYEKIKVEMQSGLHIVGKEEDIPVTLKITNSTIFPIVCLRMYFSYKNTYSANRFVKVLNVSLDSRADSTVVCKLYSCHAGNVEICLESYKVYDFLRLFSIRKKQGAIITTAVLPYYYELDMDNTMQKIPMNESDKYSPNKSGDDPSEVYEIREYREGDRPQRIHWKLSNKMGRLMIKEFGDPFDSLDILFVSLCLPTDISKQYYLYYIDSILECALSISYTLLIRKHAHYIAWYDSTDDVCRRIKIVQENDFYEAVDGLLNIKPYQRNEELLESLITEFSREQYTCFTYITGNLDAVLLDDLDAVRAQAKNMIYVIDSERQADVQSNATKMQRKAADMGIELFALNIENVKGELEYYMTIKD